MYRATLQGAIDPPWTRMEPLRIGDVPSGLSTPDTYITIERDGQPHLRIDAYTGHFGGFQELIVWRSFVVLGSSSTVYLISAETRNVTNVSFEMYFGHLYPTHDELLIASGSELICINPDATERWRNTNLGCDGVLVDNISGDTIKGQGEWDPPGGWRPFRVSLSTGRPVPD